MKEDINLEKYRVTADIGGTFTDFVFYNTKTGDFKAGKTMSTPEDLSDAIIHGMSKEFSDFSNIEYFVHGTTCGLNAVLQRKGAKVALITTKGFGDIYEIARSNKTELYNMRYRKPKPLIERSDVFTVDERILYNGEIEKTIDHDEIRSIAQIIKQKGYEAVAVCLINSYRYPDHEKEIGVILNSLLPGVPIALSCVVAREWREYERTSTVVMNAYIAPIVMNYLQILESRMLKNQYNGRVYIMQSGGGVIDSDVARDAPIQTLISGPVGGAIGNISLSEMLGYQNSIGIDMGGTSYDVNIVVNGRPDVSTETHLEGFPLLTPMVNIFTVGAGGGSIAWVQNGGLRVGPESAGADPGPACYGKGGSMPTITDANVVLGRIDCNSFLGGQMILDLQAATSAVDSIAQELNLSVQETAEGICKVADAKMADAIRQITVRKGLDPRKFVLIAYGGAGPMHACTTAEELGISTVLVPEAPGTFSAWGMHQADIRQDSVRTVTSDISQVDYVTLESAHKEMKDEVSRIMLTQNIDPDHIEYFLTADLRYNGQDSTINVPLSLAEINATTLEILRKDFDQTHYDIHGHNNPEGQVDLVNIRLVGLGKMDRITKIKESEYFETLPDPRAINEVVFYNKKYETKMYQREKLRCGNKLSGPVIIEELTTTTIVPPGYQVTVDEYRNLLIEKNKRG